MRILYLYQYFTTPNGSWSTRAYEFARRWTDAGEKVTVVTSVYDKSDLRPHRLVTRTTIDGIDVIVLNINLSNKHGVLRRLYSFFAYALLASYFAVRVPSDVVLVSSGPMTVGIPALVARLLKGSRIVFEVRDLWPDGAIQLGLLRNTFLIKTARWFEKICYRSADQIVALSVGMANQIANGQKADVHVVPNASDIRLFGEVHHGRIPEWVRGKHLVLYTGTIGRMDDCRQILAMADLLQRRGRRDIEVVLMGDGSEKRELEAVAKAGGLMNVHFLGLLTKRQVADWLSSAICSLVVFRDIPIFDTNSPNKLFDALAAGTPVVQTTQGWIKELLEREECGITVPPGDSAAMADAVLQLVTDSTLRARLSGNARRVARELFDRDRLAEDMRQILHSAANTIHG